jgi:restriction endonuclease S subunit
MNVEYKFLGEIAEIIAGIPEEKKKGNKEYKYFCIQPSHLNDNNKLLKFDVVYRTKPINEKALVKKEDILVKRLNPSSINLVMDSYKNTYVTSSLMIIRCKEKYIPDYLAAILEIQGLTTLKHYTKRGITVQTISKKEIRNITIPFPDIKTQKLLGKIWLLNKNKQKLLNDWVIKENDFIKSLFNTILAMKGSKNDDKKRN